MRCRIQRTIAWYLIMNRTGFQDKKVDPFDIIGRQFTKLYVKEYVGLRGSDKKHHYLCRCECGNEKEIRRYNLIAEKVKSCGCSNSAIAIATKQKLREQTPPSVEFWKRVRKSDGCWEWTGILTPRNYGFFHFNKKRVLAHRWSYQYAYATELTPDVFVCHHCDNPRCVRPDHLFAGSAKDNALDAANKGRMAHGPNHGMAKLTASDIDYIVANYRLERTSTRTGKRSNTADLAEKFGVNKSTIQRTVKLFSGGAIAHRKSVLPCLDLPHEPV